MVAIKLLALGLFIAVGLMNIEAVNYTPFAPNGFTGIHQGAAIVFFAYIGFDAISTAAEETKNPQRNMPIGILGGLAICTVIYVIVGIVATGLVPYQQLRAADPLARALEVAGLPIASWFVAFGAVVSLTAVLLVFQLGQPRIWMSMSRDGLLPPIFASIHPRFKTPWFSTLMTGVLVAVPALFMNLTEVTDLTSIGTLFAFVLVSAGVLLLDGGGREGKYVKYIDSRWVVPFLYFGTWIYAATTRREALLRYFSFVDPANPSVHGWEVMKHEIPMLVFIAFAGVLAVLCFVKRLSLIPVMGVLTCGYLMTELGLTNWIRFGIWLLIGLVLY
ncbi:MAG: amino acid permease, partial [Burkholderiales bacterium]